VTIRAIASAGRIGGSDVARRNQRPVFVDAGGPPAIRVVKSCSSAARTCLMTTPPNQKSRSGRAETTISGAPLQPPRLFVTEGTASPAMGRRSARRTCTSSSLGSQLVSTKLFEVCPNSIAFRLTMRRSTPAYPVKTTPRSPRCFSGGICRPASRSTAPRSPRTPRQSPRRLRCPGRYPRRFAAHPIRKSPCSGSSDARSDVHLCPVDIRQSHDGP
jgi:hypothetical protein